MWGKIRLLLVGALVISLAPIGAQPHWQRFRWSVRWKGAQADSVFMAERKHLQAQGYWACQWRALDTTGLPWQSIWLTGPLAHKVVLHSTSDSTGKRGKAITMKYLNRHFQHQIQEAENQGYPFARIDIDSIWLDDKQVWHWAYQSELGPAFTWDTLAIEGTLEVNRDWLAKYLQMRAGRPFDNRKLAQSDNTMRGLPWVSWKKPARVAFAGTEAFPVLYADSRPANEADGIIGIMPNERKAGAILINGEVNVKLNNLFRRGKQLVGEWRQIDPNQQRLLLSYRHPVLAGLPWEVGGQFFLLRQDSSFLQRQWRLELQYLYGNGHKLGIVWAEQVSQLLGLVRPSASTLLVAGTQFRQYGLQWEWQQLDDYFYPRSGINQSLSLQIGTKTLTSNPSTDLNLPRNSLQWALHFHHSRYIPLSPRHNLLLRAQSRWLINDHLQRNELYRVGGLTTLRGFNENTFFAAQYGILTAEYRFYTESTTFLSLFVDQGWIRDQTFRGVVTDYPSGLGAGASFKTGPGIFTINYALGRRAGSPIRWQDAKIHFGLTARF